MVADDYIDIIRLYIPNNDSPNTRSYYRSEGIKEIYFAQMEFADSFTYYDTSVDLQCSLDDGPLFIPVWGVKYTLQKTVHNIKFVSPFSRGIRVRAIVSNGSFSFSPDQFKVAATMLDASVGTTEVLFNNINQERAVNTHKGYWIKNTHASNNLEIGVDVNNTTPAYGLVLEPGKDIYLENAHSVYYLKGSGASTTYEYIVFSYALQGERNVPWLLN